MKKTLVLFALVDLSAAVVVLSAVHGQNQNAQSRFRRQGAEECIPNQYIVVLNG